MRLSRNFRDQNKGYMTTAALSVNSYLSSLPADRQEVMDELHKTIRKNLPKGFEEGISSGMICYYVPHSKYPNGYHCNPKQPLPFVSLASQKNFIALYHMGLYAMPDLLQWFTTEYPKHSKTKLDMGKSCIRFKKPDQVPIKLIAELMQKVSPDQWIEVYEKNLRR